MRFWVWEFRGLGFRVEGVGGLGCKGSASHGPRVQEYISSMFLREGTLDCGNSQMERRTFEMTFAPVL